MFCNLIGLSPCDIVLHDVDIRLIKALLHMLNNRFDVGVLDAVKSEFDYCIEAIDNMVIDYLSKDDRAASKRLVVNMSSFGGEDRSLIEARLAAAPKGFMGNMRVNGQVIAVSSEGAKKVLEKLYQGKKRLCLIRESIERGDFSDKTYFGRPLTWWANSRSHSWLSVYATDRIERQDDIVGLRNDAVQLLQYVVDADDLVTYEEVKRPEYEDVASRFKELSGDEMSTEEQALADSYVNSMQSRDVNSLGADSVAALTTLLVYCMLASRQYDRDTADGLEKCGLFFMNPVKAEFMLSKLNDLTLLPERRIHLVDLESGDSYHTILSGIIAACENNLTPIGERLNGGGRW